MEGLNFCTLRTSHSHKSPTHGGGGRGGIEKIFRKEKIRFECWLYSTLAINLMLTQQNGFFASNDPCVGFDRKRDLHNKR